MMSKAQQQTLKTTLNSAKASPQTAQSIVGASC
jgi:hypothetical protein